MTPTVRPATDADEIAVRNVLDAAMLAVDDLTARLAAGDVLVADDDGRIVGAAVLDPAHTHAGSIVDAIAVRRNRRDQGIGRQLVAAVAERGPVVAEFDADVRPFYERLGFEVRQLDDGRHRGVLPAGDAP